ncbi:MAG: hypothetical protein ABTQ25_19620 [Nitrosomonas ureae]
MHPGNLSARKSPASCSVGYIDNWDGLIYWYVKYIGQQAEFLKDKYLNSRYRAAKSAIEHNATLNRTRPARVERIKV